MATRPDEEMKNDDDDFADIYKEYTGPPRSTLNPKGNKRVGSDEEEEEACDPNSVPKDFTSRDAKFWEAKSKATERNWKKRKDEEMICKICGESGHFTQGCPSTLGANRKSQDFFERVAAREPHVRALFTDKVIHGIENEVGCKIKMEEKFIIVSGKDRLVIAKGVDAVHKVIKGEGGQKGSSGSQRSRSRSAEHSPVNSQLQRSESQRSYSGHPRDVPQYQQRFSRQDKNLEDRFREDQQKFSRGSPPAYGKDGARSLSGHSRSPVRNPYSSNIYSSYDGRNHNIAGYKAHGWDMERRGPDLLPDRQLEYSTYPRTLEDLELECKSEAMELARIRDTEEDEENYRHRETIREMRESFMKKLAVLRGSHARLGEDFLQLDAQRRQQESRQKIPLPGFGGYRQYQYSEYDGFSANPQYSQSSLSSDSRVRYPNNLENYSARSDDFHHQRHEDFGKAYNQ